MNGTPANKHNSPTQRSPRPTLVIGAIIAGVLFTAVAVITLSRGSAPKPEQPQSPTAATEPAADETSPAPSSQLATTDSLQNTRAGESRPATPQFTHAVPAPPPPPASVLALPRSEPTPYARQLAGSLSAFDASSGPLTPERAGQWKQTLQQLVQQGSAGAAAIREYLEKNTDWV